LLLGLALGGGLAGLRQLLPQLRQLLRAAGLAGGGFLALLRQLGQQLLAQLVQAGLLLLVAQVLVG
jgi:hypothetical protein